VPTCRGVARAGDKRHTSAYHARVKPFRWSPEKNDLLKADRGVSFESMVVAIDGGGLLDVLVHPNARRYPNQRVMVVAHDGYVFLVPFVDSNDHYFLKTIIPSRKAVKEYLGGGADNAKA
jgi:uncharacterized DUF497 family protein